MGHENSKFLTYFIFLVFNLTFPGILYSSIWIARWNNRFISGIDQCYSLCENTIKLSGSEQEEQILL